MKKTLFVILAGVFVVSLCSGYSLAYTNPTFYKEGSINGVKYLTGGVGLDERAAMQKTAKGNYNLQLVFAQLPNGQYTITVTHDGKSEVQRLVVGKNFQRVIFDWKG